MAQKGRQPALLVDALGLVGKQHGIAVEGNAHFLRVAVACGRGVDHHARRGKADGQGLAHIDLVGREEQVGAQRPQVGKRIAPAREHAALYVHVGRLGRGEHAHAAGRVVAREHHHLHALHFGRIEGQQLAHQREGDARACRLVHQVQLAAHVGLLVARIEQPVLFLEVEQCAR